MKNILNAIVVIAALTTNFAVADEMATVLNGVRDKDGAIHFSPPLCGPGGYVIHDPKYGDLCAQKGSWTAQQQEQITTQKLLIQIQQTQIETLRVLKQIQESLNAKE